MYAHALVVVMVCAPTSDDSSSESRRRASMLSLVSSVPLMPPKKATSERKVLLGRPGNNLRIGIVGPLSVLPLSRSIAHLVTQGCPTSGNRPSSTPYPTQVSPRHLHLRLSLLSRSRQGRQFPLRDHQSRGASCRSYVVYQSYRVPSQEARIPVPDPRFDWLCDLYKPVSRVPAFLTCIDIAGLTAVRPRRPPSFFLSVLTLSSLDSRAPQQEQVSAMPSSPTSAPSTASSRSSAPLTTPRSSTSRASSIPSATWTSSRTNSV